MKIFFSSCLLVIVFFWFKKVPILYSTELVKDGKYRIYIYKISPFITAFNRTSDWDRPALISITDSNGNILKEWKEEVLSIAQVIVTDKGISVGRGYYDYPAEK